MGRIALVTGASRGIGKAIALELASKGVSIAVNFARNEAQAIETVNDLISLGVKAKAYKCDVSNYNACESMIKEIEKDFGGIDILVNNAGITKDNLLMRMSQEDFKSVVDINLGSAFNCSKLVVRSMMKKRFGRIINISSIVGVCGNAGQTNYSSSKAALIGFTKSLAKEVASRGITVNAIAPGFIKTDMTAVLDEAVVKNLSQNIPVGYLGEATDIAKAVDFLASEGAGYITGNVLMVTGGMGM